LAKAVKARNLYLSQPSATWYQIDVQANDASASFTSFTQATETPIPTPSDPKQTQGGAPWNVDHIFELQVIGEMCKSAKPYAPLVVECLSISLANLSLVTAYLMPRGRRLRTQCSHKDRKLTARTWCSAHAKILRSLCTSIAQDVTVLDNLQGIPNAVNTFKKQVFTGNLTGVGNPSNGDDATYWNFFGPAVQKYLSDNKQGLYDGVVDDLGDTLSSIGDNNAAVKTYFTSYAQHHYQGAIDFLSTWSGKPYVRSGASTTAPSTSSAAAASAVSCYHAADPQNTCAAIADGPGWCECGDSTATYAVKPTGQPCAWTTLPPTTSFDCATSAPAPSPTNNGTSSNL